MTQLSWWPWFCHGSTQRVRSLVCTAPTLWKVNMYKGEEITSAQTLEDNKDLTCRDFDSRVLLWTFVIFCIEKAFKGNKVIPNSIVSFKTIIYYCMHLIHVTISISVEVFLKMNNGLKYHFRQPSQLTRRIQVLQRWVTKMINDKRRRQDMEVNALISDKFIKKQLKSNRTDNKYLQKFKINYRDQELRKNGDNSEWTLQVLSNWKTKWTNLWISNGYHNSISSQKETRKFPKSCATSLHLL